MEQTIEVYTFQIKEKGAKDYLLLSDGVDIYPLIRNQFKSYVESTEGREIGYTMQRTLEVPRLNGMRLWGKDDGNRYVYGVIKSGKYGKRIEIADRSTPEVPAYTSRSNDEAVLKPFFFLISIPRTTDTGFIVLERTDNESLKQVLQKLLVGFLNRRRTDDEQERSYTVRFNNFLSREYVEGLRDGAIQSLTLRRQTMPRDITDRYLRDLRYDVKSVSLTIKFKKGILPNSSLSNEIKNGRTIFSSEAFTSFFDDSQREIVTKSAINGVSRTRTVYLSDESKQNIRPYYIVKVTQSANGYSDYHSIRQAVYRFIEDNRELTSHN